MNERTSGCYGRASARRRAAALDSKMRRIFIAVCCLLISQSVIAQSVLKLELTESLEMHGGPSDYSVRVVTLDSQVVTNWIDSVTIVTGQRDGHVKAKITFSKHAKSDFKARQGRIGKYKPRAGSFRLILNKTWLHVNDMTGEWPDMIEKEIAEADAKALVSLLTKKEKKSNKKMQAISR